MATLAFHGHRFRFRRLLGQLNQVLLYNIFLGFGFGLGLYSGLGVGVPARILQLCLPVDGTVVRTPHRLKIVDVELLATIHQPRFPLGVIV